ncbi:MAG TPA: energy transducer TonB [Candidatus Acidoferrum sp.]|jgi:TonB family protein|nr:energy transducer TonB [Candidatus Acidoferrum sp.]
MARSRTIALSAGILCAIASCIFSLPVSGQTPAEIEALASRTAERVTKTHQQHVFLAGLQECRLDLEVCTMFETSLHADLEKMIPGVRFIKRESVINILQGRGFLALDAYLPDVLKAVATSAGADILVTDALLWQSDGYDLTSEVYDAVQAKKLEQFRAKVARTMADSGGEPLVFKDPESGVSIIIFRGKPSRTPVVTYPTCDKCPDPSYTPEARADRLHGRVLLLVTVTEQGMADQIGILDGLRDGLTEHALEAVRRWQFKPAIGKDGKPFATRMPIEVNFRLQ